MGFQQLHHLLPFVLRTRNLRLATALTKALPNRLGFRVTFQPEIYAFLADILELIYETILLKMDLILVHFYLLLLVILLILDTRVQ